MGRGGAQRQVLGRKALQAMLSPFALDSCS